MKKYNLEKAMFTRIEVWKRRLITKEKMENYCKGKEDRILSVNDDLEILFERIQLGEEPDDRVKTYFLPKLTDYELELVERKDEDFMTTFVNKMGADVDKSEMVASESNSKYVHGCCGRKTFTIENSSHSIEDKLHVFRSQVFRPRRRASM